MRGARRGNVRQRPPSSLEPVVDWPMEPPERARFRPKDTPAHANNRIDYSAVAITGRLKRPRRSTISRRRGRVDAAAWIRGLGISLLRAIGGAQSEVGTIR